MFSNSTEYDVLVFVSGSKRTERNLALSCSKCCNGLWLFYFHRNIPWSLGMKHKRHKGKGEKLDEKKKD
jgi:hypothetical protein